MTWWSRGLTASRFTGLRAYARSSLIIFLCPKYLGRNHWADTRFHSANIGPAFIFRISLVNPFSIAALTSSRFLPCSATFRYSSSVSFNKGVVSSSGVSSGISSIFRIMAAIISKSLRVGWISVSFSKTEKTDSFNCMAVSKPMKVVSVCAASSLRADEYSWIVIPVSGWRYGCPQALAVLTKDSTASSQCENLSLSNVFR